MRISRIRRSLAPAVLAAAMVAGGAPAAVAAPSTHAGAPPVQASAQCANPVAIAHWWQSRHWPRNGKKQYRFDQGDLIRYIWGGEKYKNVSQPKLPNGNYNAYDVNSHGSATAHRDAERLVRNANNGDLYYTPNHYRRWCYMGAGW